MEAGSKPEKSTGYTLPTTADTENASAPPKSTGGKKVSPVSKNVHTKGESLISTGEVSASKILAVQVMMGDFKALKDELPTSWMASNDGKIYWCADFTGHALSVENGALLIDGDLANDVLERLIKG